MFIFFQALVDHGSDLAGGLFIAKPWPGMGPRRLRRSRPLRQGLLFANAGLLFHGRRGYWNTGWLLSSHRTHRRRDQYQRPSAGHSWGGRRFGMRQLSFVSHHFYADLMKFRQSSILSEKTQKLLNFCYENTMNRLIDWLIDFCHSGFSK